MFKNGSQDIGIEINNREGHLRQEGEVVGVNVVRASARSSTPLGVTIAELRR